jgi:hypothetical protein
MCETLNGGDPIIQWDKIANRWVALQLAYNGGFSSNSICMAISTSTDALGSYNRYEFNFGINLPDYPKLAQLWWQQIGDVNSGAFTPQQAMDRLAKEMDQVMARMEEADKKDKVYGGCGPRLNPEKDPNEWLGKPNGPKAKLANEKPQGVTVDYDELIKRWAKR